MNESIAIVSFVPSDEHSEGGFFAGIRISQGEIPRIVDFLIDETEQDKNLRLIISERIKSITDKATIFVSDDRTKAMLRKFAGMGIDFTDVIVVKQLLILFYPSWANLNIDQLSVSAGIKLHKSYPSPAKKEVRLIWELLKKLWQNGLEFDLNYINTLEEYCQGLSFEKFVVLLRKEIIKQFPDKPIKLGMQLNMNDYDLFSARSKEVDHFSYSAEWVSDCFQDKGLLAQKFAGYESRASQVTMAEVIIKGFSEGTNTIIEAGTGTGKSIAYLIPALWWARKNKKKVVVATHTINLQDQLYNKDLPFLKDILPFKFKTALLKGKNNYICLKNLYQNRTTADLSLQERLTFVRLFSWTRETLTGDISEIPNHHQFPSIGAKFGADSSYCEPGNCGFAKECFLVRSRKNAEDADLIIVNHSLLLADIKTNNKIIPEYSNLVLDEAHNIYQTALKQLGFEISHDHILRISDNFLGSKGSLISILRKNRPYWSEVLPLINWGEFYHNVDQVQEITLGIREQSKELFELCQALLAERINLRINELKIGKNSLSILTIAMENLSYRLRNLLDVLNKLYALLSLENEQLESIRHEINKARNEINLLADGLGQIINTNETRVTYIEKSGLLYLKDTCVDIKGILNEKLFTQKRSTILTSATLTVENSFEYFAQDIGLDNYQSLTLPSPFDFHKQMLFCIVNDIPLNQVSDAALIEKTTAFIKQITEMMNGRTLVLFTSHRYLRQVYHQLSMLQTDLNLNILAQGINGTRESLLRDFIQNNNSILLGTNSFWEGIDIPGDDLRCVIMTKLPFWPPDTPILEAKSNLIESQGDDPFRNLHLPEAVIRFKQGFGRLIRSKNDNGVVILLDDRILKKRYGQSFLKSLPIESYYQGSSEKVITQVKHWV